MRHLSRENLFRGANNFGAYCYHSRNTGASPFSFTCITQHTGPMYSFTSHPKDEAIMVKCLAQGHKRRDQPGRDSNPHSDNTRTWVQCTRPPAMALHILVYTVYNHSACLLMCPCQTIKAWFWTKQNWTKQNGDNSRVAKFLEQSLSHCK